MANEVVKRTAETVKGYLIKNKGAIMAAMPTGANYERFCRTVINAISTTPALAECTVDSLFLSCVKAFSVGIEPNGPTMEGYLVPFRDKGQAKAQFMPSYRGLISLARRSGMVSLVYADAIRKGDKYKISRGTDPKLEHEPTLDHGEPMAYYAVAKMDDGSFDYEIMTPLEVDAIRKRSKAASAGPWVSDYEEMAKKTVLKRLTKRLPVSVENLAFAKAVQADNRAETGDDMEGVIDIEGIEVPPAKVATSPFEKQIEAKQEAEAKEAGLVADPPPKSEVDDLAKATYQQLICIVGDALTKASLTTSDADAWASKHGSKALPEMPLAQLRGICRGIDAWIAEVRKCKS